MISGSRCADRLPDGDTGPCMRFLPDGRNQVRRLERYRQEHPDVEIQPPGAGSAVWCAFRDGNLIAYGFTLMAFLERLEALPEPSG